MSDQPLILAVPSKGRLQENTALFFSRAGLAFNQSGGTRDYRATISGLADVDVQFVSAAEIASLLACGAVHLGVTGEDLIRETVHNADQVVELLSPLGFGFANVVVAAPQAWIDARTMADIHEIAADIRARRGRKLRVATKYVNLTRAFFAEKGVTDYVIVESAGATEGAPNAGSAEIIVDITTSGATLNANGLKVIDDGVILRSEANLVASLAADWSERARSAARALLARIAAEEQARKTREIRAALPETAELPLGAIVEPFHLAVQPRADDAAVVLWCPEEQVFALVAALQEAGAPTVSVRRLDYLFTAGNPLMERLLARIGA
ncbi:MAG: ATP phosphoribosyltransferase [Methylobacteriaceae bacterium]|jgi:ATP phosphoribosyltransferase|nr:ATP phosphoribosyltransferase [Methylobacteriaceae bacterium]